MILEIDREMLKQIHTNGAAAYPEEGAGLMLGTVDGARKQVQVIMEFENAREAEARHNRYLITPQEILRGEQNAERLGMEILGVFHSHPDHPNRPSEYDREYAVPWYSYLITSVNSGTAIESRSWLLSEDHTTFHEEIIEIKE